MRRIDLDRSQSRNTFYHISNFVCGVFAKNFEDPNSDCNQSQRDRRTISRDRKKKFQARWDLTIGKIVIGPEGLQDLGYSFFVFGWGIFEDLKVCHRVLYLNLSIFTFQLCGSFLVVLGHIWHPRLISLCSEFYSLNFKIFGARAFWALFEKMGHLYESILTPFFKLLDALSTDTQTRWNSEGLWAKSSQSWIWATSREIVWGEAEMLTRGCRVGWGLIANNKLRKESRIVFVEIIDEKSIEIDWTVQFEIQSGRIKILCGGGGGRESADLFVTCAKQVLRILVR